MAEPTRKEAHLMVATIRVLEHQNQRLPLPAEIADFIEMSESAVRLHLNSLSDLGIVVLVDSAFETHVEIKNHLLIENLSEDAGPEIADDLAAFDLKKEEEARKMANLFESGEHEKNREERLNQMDKDLQDFRGRKPMNPFGDN